MNSIYFDLVCGASGDMILSSLLDLGVPVEWLSTQLAKMGIEQLKIGYSRTQRSGVSCGHVDIHAPEQHEHRHPSQILEIFKKGGYNHRVLDSAERVLMRLARAESHIHQIPVEKVHFHEIGAVDTIVDIMGTCLCLEYLDIEEVLFGDLPHGKGMIEMAHGRMPVPAPATAFMMQGFRTRELDVEDEILTPTGCAILTELGQQVTSLPGSLLEKVGYGSGDKQFPGLPNVLRAQLRSDQEADQTPESVYVLESDMDHISGEVMAYAAERAAASGALDINWTPIYMKKGRPGYRMTALCSKEKLEAVIQIILKETRTLGVRYYEAQRKVAQREKGWARLMGADVREKKCWFGDVRFTKAEFDSLAKIARESDRSVLEVLEAYFAARGR